MSAAVPPIHCTTVLAHKQDAAREVFLAKQSSGRRGRERWVLGSFAFFRMHRITDIYFVGGFGTVQWIDVDEYLTATPDSIATNEPLRTLQVRFFTAWRCAILQPSLRFLPPPPPTYHDVLPRLAPPTDAQRNVFGGAQDVPQPSLFPRRCIVHFH